MRWKNQQLCACFSYMTYQNRHISSHSWLLDILKNKLSNAREPGLRRVSDVHSSRAAPNELVSFSGNFVFRNLNKHAALFSLISLFFITVISYLINARRWKWKKKMTPDYEKCCYVSVHLKYKVVVFVAEDCLHAPGV